MRSQTGLRLVARTLVDNAIDGDTTAARECFDRMDGKVAQGVDATGQVRGDITVNWVRPARIDDLGMLICGWPMFAAGKRGEIIGASAVLQQLRQLGDVYGDTPRLIAGVANCGK